METVAVVCTLYVVPFVFHLIAFYLLYRTKYTTKFNQVQRFILLNLSFSEMGLCIFICLLSIFNGHEINFYFLSIRLIIFSSIFFFSYVVLTFDRFLMVFLNLRYSSVVSLQRIRRLFAGCYGAAVLSTIIVCLLLRAKNQKAFYRYWVVYFWPVGDVFCTLIAIITYTYIAVSRKLRQKKVGTIWNSSRRFSMRSSSTLLVLSFVITFVVPDSVMFALFLSSANGAHPFGVDTVLHVFYSFGLCADAIIYIFSLKSVHLPRML